MTWLLTIIMLAPNGAIMDKQIVAITATQQTCDYIGSATAKAMTMQSGSSMFVYQCEQDGVGS